MGADDADGADGSAPGFSGVKNVWIVVMLMERAIKVPPVLHPPRALAMVSAVMARLPAFGGVRLARIVRRGWHLRQRPLGQNREEARDVRGNLPGVLSAEITT